jgi:hypothetical protein
MLRTTSARHTIGMPGAFSVMLDTLLSRCHLASRGPSKTLGACHRRLAPSCVFVSHLRWAICACRDNYGLCLVRVPE